MKTVSHVSHHIAYMNYVRIRYIIRRDTVLACAIVAMFDREQKNFHIRKFFEND